MSAETELSRRIREVLESIGIPSVRVQSGRVHVGSHVVHLAPKGTPDLRTPYGWLEVKYESDESPEQVAFREAWEKHGDRVATVRSVPEAIRVVGRWKKEREST